MIKKTLCFLLLLIVFVGGCAPLFPPEADLTPIPSETLKPVALPATWTPVSILATTPTSIAKFFPEGLLLAYILDDTIHLWKDGNVVDIHTQESISNPTISYDGTWITFNHLVQNEHPRFEIWAIGIDGNNLHRLLAIEEITALSEDDSQLIIQYYDWMPKSHQLIFTSYKVIEGPPGVSPIFDLYLLDIFGELQQLAAPGEGGDYFPSPDGRYVATSTTSRISLIDLETGENRTLLEFDPLMIPTESWRTPELYWGRNSHHFTATIPPPDIYYPSEWTGGYAGGLEQIWRMHITGQVELLAEVEPAVGAPTVLSISPYAEYYFSIETGTCGDGAFFITHLRTLPDGKEFLTLPCSSEFPNWLPDGKSYLYRSDGDWFLGDVTESITHYLNFANYPDAENFWPSYSLEWIDHTSFLLRNRSSAGCTNYFGNRDGLLIPLGKSETSGCPWINFRIPTNE